MLYCEVTVILRGANHDCALLVKGLVHKEFKIYDFCLCHGKYWHENNIMICVCSFFIRFGLLNLLSLLNFSHVPIFLLQFNLLLSLRAGAGNRRKDGLLL